MKKVIGFDGWTTGSHHYQRLVKAFSDNGLELILLHLGSWGSEKGRPTQEIIGCLRVRDIAYYGRRNFHEILEMERPDAVVFLSTDAFAHRAFIRYCRQLNIPTVHLFHGLQQLMDSAPLRPSALQRLWLMRGHIGKLLRHFLPVYARSLWKTGASLSDWQRFASDVVGRFRGRRPESAAQDSKTDRACVYIDSEAVYAVRTYGYCREQVVAVGNPDLLSFGFSDGLVASRVKKSILLQDTVVYIDTALVDYGAVFSSKDDFVRHIAATSAELARQGKRLIFKPHPSTGDDITSKLAAAGIGVCANSEFLVDLQRSCACITEPSSAALIPAMMGLPLFLANYGKLARQEYGELIEGYPRARRISDMRDFSFELAAESEHVNEAAVLQWITRNCGPRPASCMPERVAEVVLTLIDARCSASLGAA